MELRTVRYFVAVADAGSVTAAAKLVHITQPSLSRQLHQLEHELGLTLFAQINGRLALTAAGRTFLPTARALTLAADATKSAAADIGAGRLQSISIVAPAVTLIDVVSPFIATFGPEDPMPSVSELHAGQGYGALERGADLVLGALPPSADLAHSWVAQLPIYAYVRPQDPWARHDTLPLEDLAEEDLLLLTPDAHIRWILDAAMASAALSYRSVKEFSSSQVAQAVAASGRGIAVVSDDSRFGLHGLRIGIPTGSLRLNLYAVWNPRHHAAQTLAEFARSLSTYVVSHYGQDVAPSR
ncbi:MAG: LysR family transcriptional regulator [Ornithinimicrobium sp.]